MKRKLLLFALLMALFAPWAAMAQEELTVNNGTNTSSYVPFYGFYADYGARSQFIIPAAQLEDMDGGTIQMLTFYTSTASTSFDEGVTVYLKEVDYTVFQTAALEDWSSMTAVWTGNLTVSSNQLEIDFSSNGYTYNGGNLMIGFQVTTWGSSCPSMSWYGVSQSSGTYTAVYNTANSGHTWGTTPSRLAFLPKTTFSYTPGGGLVCEKPSEVTAEDVTSNSASIRWEGGSGTYNMEYKKVSEETWTSVLTNSSATSAELTGLDPATYYTAKVQSVCDFGDTTLYREKTVNFRTLCAEYALPHYYGFEDAGEFECWTLSGSTSSSTGIASVSDAPEGSKVFRFYYGEQNAYLLSPTFSGTDTGLDVGFQYMNSSTTTSYVEQFQVGYTTDPDAAPADYIYGETIVGENEWVTYENSFPANTKRIAIKYIYTNGMYLRLDAFSFEAPATCPKPKNLTLANKDGHTATLRWVPAVEGQTQWQICLNDDEDNLERVTSTDSTYTLTGLTGDTRYTVKVRAYCNADDQSYWSNEVTFTTDVTCVAPTAFTVPTTDITNHGATLNWTSDATEWVVAYKLTSAHDSTYVEVPVTENPYTLDGLDTVTNYTVKVRANCGEVDGLSAWSSTRAFTTLNTYPAPSKAACDSVFAYTAYLSWFERGTAMDWEVTYKLATDTIYTDTILVPSNPYCLGEMDPLIPGTDYVFKVRAKYFTEQGETASPWSNEVAFTTLLTCPAPTDVVVYDSTITANAATLTWKSSVYSDSWNVKYRNPAYVIGIDEHFSTTAVPQGWTRYNTLLSDVLNGTALNEYSGGWNFSNTNVFGAYHAKVNVFGTSCKYWLVTPELTLADTAAMRFDLALTDYGNTNPIENDTLQADDRFVVLIYANNAWTNLREWNNSGSEYVYNAISVTGENVTIDLSAYQGQTVKIAFYAESTVGDNGDNDLHIDNVFIGKFVEATPWQTVPAEEVPFELTGLNPLTDYEVVVEGNCGEETSEESASVFFTTLPSCLAPTDLVVIDSTITAHTATLRWTENGNATAWVIEYTAYVNDSTLVVDSINVTENPYTLTGLRAETPYTVKVQAYCSESDQSDWSNTARFSTLIACPAPTDLAVIDTTITTTGATITWNGTSDNYVVMFGEPDPDSLAMGTLFFVDFNNQVIPTNWTNDATYPFTVVNGHIQNSNTGVHSSTSSISFSMSFNVESLIEFDAECRGEGTSTYYDHCDFYIDGSRELYHGADVTSAGWLHYSFPVTAGTHTFTWSYTKDSSVSSAGDYFAVDNIMVSALMPVPSSWVEYPAEEATYTFEELEPGTTYFVKVKSDCGQDGESLESNTISFTTIASCVTPIELSVPDSTITAHTAILNWTGNNDSYLVNLGVDEPIVLESADFADGVPTAWNNTSAYPWTIVNGYMQSGNAGVSSSTSTIVSDTVNFTTDGIIEFDAQCMGEGTSWDVCTFSIDGNTMFTIGANGEQWDHYSYNVTAGNHIFTWSFSKDSSVNATGDHFAVDNVVMKIANTVWNEEPFTADTTSYTFGELNAESTYFVQVQGICGEETSEWSEVISFTTPVACLPVENFAIDTVGAHMAVISWTEVGNATAWEICVDGDENNLIAADDTIFMVEGLRQDSDHTLKVRANCGDEDGPSVWSNLLSFHTLVACAAPDSLAVDNIGTESATLMWTGESDSYIVRYMPWYQVGNDTVGTGEFIIHTYDLSEYSGTGSIAIRHYNISDLFWLNVDDIKLTNAAGDIIYTQNFENCNGDIPSEISTMDLDGDGHDWQIISSANMMNVNGSYGIGSESYDNDYTFEALYPDNWLIISGVELGGQFSFAARGQQAEFAEENFGVFVSPEAGAGEEIVEGDNTVDIWDLTPNTPYAWQVAGVCGADTSNWVASFFATQDDVLVFKTAGDWNNANNWEPSEIPTVGNNVRIEADAIIPAGVIAEANQITIDTTGSITIKDGGQLKQSSNALKVTIEKGIVGYNDTIAVAGGDDGLRADEGENNNYYLIATPFNGVTILGASTWNHVDSLLYAPYDLYTFDPANGEDQEWVNYKANPSHPNFVYESNGEHCLMPIEGYLYANENNKTLVFKGTINKSNNNYKEKVIAYTELNKGWVLVGNPFTCNAYLTVIDDEGETEANYYVMNAAGDNFVLAETADGIAPLTAAFVNFDTTAVKVRIYSEMPQPVADSNAKFHGTTGKFVMNLSQDGNNVDKAVIRFGKGSNLEKMSLKNNSKLYVPAKDKEYAVVYSRNEANMPVSFKAETAGSYTINCNAEGVSFKELVLIDNANDTKVDLLANPSYTFETEAGEFAGRFTIVYKVK